ncbi:MAG TPA: biotin carboxylase N-terminal domain-containing protein [Mycobacteriales bacterium]|jgi:acetyl/propionyl-CoA carboxylase alpha subunit|nr:biotin carboxylase N-terminal domain-containing protein [Mycobacteriales bacterium]
MQSLLVANRGEIARRVFRTARAMGLTTVAVYSDPDADAPFVREADAAVRLPGTVAADTYLRGDLIIAAARLAGTDAIHPGYGFLSENAEFAAAVIDAGLTWVGPPPSAIAAMGSKLEAKRMMRDAGVPTLPWAEDVDGADEVGYPLLVKASAGGGGRGMRIVRSADDLTEAVEGARREAAGAFGDATVFLERYLESPRHVELQVFADHHGNVVSLFERECSIQRRHQKIVEESPSPAVGEALRAEMGDAAVAAARAVDYVGAGTIEFVLGHDGSYYFLEMNTRLQVEHPVTELVTGLDLVRLQLLVAAGSPLPADALAPTMRGHAIEVRLYAEDAENGFLPATGRLRSFVIPETVRVDSGVESGSGIPPYYDAMIAKVVAHAPSRSEAASSLATALAGSRIHGVTTNRDLLVRILRESEFLAGTTDTAYLDRHDPALLGAPLLATDSEPIHAAIAALTLQLVRRLQAGVDQAMPSGWRNNPSGPQLVELITRGKTQVVEYAFHRGGVDVKVDDQPVEVEWHSAAYHVVDATVSGVRRRFHVVIPDDFVSVDVDSALGSSSYAVVPRFPDPTETLAAGSLVAPLPGSVVRVLVETGAAVTKGQPLVVLEAMKMEHTVTSPVDGTVADLWVAAGQQVNAGEVLAVVDDS